ncbi:hypothetical protein GXN34_23625 [Escherichia coli]|nr:hypothetical protein [Escherichia coli]
MLPSETMIWQPEFTDKTLSRKTGAVHNAEVSIPVEFEFSLTGYLIFQGPFLHKSQK